MVKLFSGYFGEFKLLLRRLIFAVLFILPCVANASIGEKDERVYVDWSQPPYNKIVLIKGNTYLRQDAFISCTGQYVAPDIILTARHCLIYQSVHDYYSMLGEKIPIERYDGKQINTVLEKYGYDINDDWALLRITDGRSFSKDYFDYYPKALQKNNNGFPVKNLQMAGFGWLRILTQDEIKKIHQKLIDVNMPAEESAETYLEKLYDDFTILLDGKELEDWDTSSETKRYRLKADKSCELTGIFGARQIPGTQKAAFNYNADCQVSEGNSGGAIWNQNNVVYGVLSRSRTDFTDSSANGGKVNVSVISASSNFESALEEMKKTSPSDDVVSDIISGRKVWNSGSVTDAAKIENVGTTINMPDNTVEALDDGTLIPFASSLVDLSDESTNSSDAATSADSEKQLESEKTEIDSLANQVVDDIKNVSSDTSNAEIFDILNNLVSYDVRLENYKKAKQAYDEAKAKEQSLGNRILGAAAIGAGGIGGMMLASGLAEQKADAAAEQDMSAYLATFKCDYGDGMNIKGGESNITLPGANVLLPLYNEYVSLAADLKSRKEALEMTPGIESEVILSASETGLYDNQSSGIDGTYASISRALMNPDGEDAEQLQAQSDKSSQNVKTGAIVGGAGVVGGAVGNVLLNGGLFDKNTNKNATNDDKKSSSGTTKTEK